MTRRERLAATALAVGALSLCCGGPSLESLRSMNLVGLDGAPLSLERFRGAPLLVNFWATWCGPCVAEMPSLEGVRAKLADTGLVVIAISDEPLETIRPFVAQRGRAWQFVVAARVLPGGAGAFRSLPQTYLYDRSGKSVYGQTGSREWDSPPSLAELRGLIAP